MSSAWLIVLLAPVGLIVLAAVSMQRDRSRLSADPLTHPGLVRLERRTMRVRLVGVGLGLVAFVAALLVGPYGRGVPSAPAAMALVIALSLIVGEIVVWRDARNPGVAGLEERQPRRYAPVTLALLTVASLTLLAVVIVWCLGHQDDRPTSATFGRAYWWRSDDGLSEQTVNPFPGQFYSIPLAVLVVATVVLATIVILLALLRPRNGADPVVVTVDDYVRRRSIEAATAVMLLAASGSLVPMLLGSLPIVAGHPWGFGATLLGALVATIIAAVAAAILAVPGGYRAPTGAGHGA